ncbi:MAG TPA: cupin domain-containing protein [Terriglobales bacterium]|nr:cupin domain-containing protein [Terriglobales bacterium]
MAATPAPIRKALLTALIEPEKLLAKVEIVEVTMGPKQQAPLHLHPCAVVGLVTEGTIAFQIEGEAMQYIHTGEAFYEPANVRVARFDNHSDTPAKFVAFYLLGQGEAELIRILE